MAQSSGPTWDDVRAAKAAVRSAPTTSADQAARRAAENLLPLPRLNPNASAQERSNWSHEYSVASERLIAGAPDDVKPFVGGRAEELKWKQIDDWDSKHKK